MEAPSLEFVPANHQRIAVWEWPGDGGNGFPKTGHNDGPPLLFAHATGLHGRCWDHIIRDLPGCHSVAFDARGHGRSSKPPPPCRWRELGSDLAALAETLNLRNAIGIGHSMGGHVTVQAAALRPETYRALLLLDPTILPPGLYGTGAPDASFTLRRRAVWNSPEEMFERFRDRPPFARWEPDILRDYCEYGLLPKPPGDASGPDDTAGPDATAGLDATAGPNPTGYVLACPPAIEASIYSNYRTAEANIYPEIATVRQPVVVMRAATARNPAVFDLNASPTAADLASKFARGRDVVLPDCSHYIPMERPDLVADEIRRLLS